ncbi:MAG: hypothetical protein KME18_05270 [Phormidium tanganyikae FI6-MK23]|jgi:hypothetical protein|nr:hypothetical protein [Phormidium tanganyikae FI6-MK23]
MSEFSDCYYLLNATTEQVVSLIRKARCYGIVLPRNDRYVPFLINGAWDAGKLVDRVIENNSGTILHYSYGKDHGLYIKVYDFSNGAFAIDIQQREPSENDLDTILVKAEQLSLVDRDRIPELRAILTETTAKGNVDSHSIK